MKTEREGRTIEVSRGKTLHNHGGRSFIVPNDYIDLDAENLGFPQESVSTELTPDEARQLARQLNDLADDIDYERSKERGR